MICYMMAKVSSVSRHTIFSLQRNFFVPVWFFAHMYLNSVCQKCMVKTDERRKLFRL